MDCVLSSFGLYAVSEMRISPLEPPRKSEFKRNFSNISRVTFMAESNTIIYHRKLPKNLGNPRRTKLTPGSGINIFSKERSSGTDPSQTDLINCEELDLTDQSVVTDGHDDCIEEEEEEDVEEYQDVEENKEEEEIVWDSDEIEAITSLFQGRIPQKPGKLNRERPLPLSLPYKLRPLGLPPAKKHVRTASPTAISSRASLFKQVYKNPEFLVGLAKEIRVLPSEETVSAILNKSARYLQKGSLSLTIRELGHMNLPERALQTFCWAQKHPHLFPDDCILASTVEVLARTHELKVPFNLKRFTSLASRGVIEAMLKGFIKGGSLSLAWKLLLVAKDCNRMLDPGIYAKFILELGKNSDKHMLVLSLLDELGEREDLNLSQQDCTAIMKVCIRLGKFEIVESLFNWFKQSGHDPSVVMYTTMIHSRYCEEKYREALALVWEMESSNCLFDLPAYRVVIKLCVALNDLSRTVRYFSKLKEVGFSPTYDIYRDLIKIYLVSGRLAKCREVCKELEIAGFMLDKQMMSQLLQLKRGTRLGF